LENRDLFLARLLEWFEKSGRDFSWRRTDDPYRVLVAEMMLQKTTATQVSRLFDAFIREYPDPRALAEANESEVEAGIRPLGMEHKRAVRLKKSAQAIVNEFGGRVPESREDLLSLSGVGDYVANAVLILAFKRDLPLLDTNIARVLGRVFEIKPSKARARTDRDLWRKIGEMVPKGKARQFNLGLVDFGALVCLSRNPKCGVCPMVEFCLYYSELKRQGKNQQG
jgi:A/G-specific adenine glycosylase